MRMCFVLVGRSTDPENAPIARRIDNIEKISHAPIDMRIEQNWHLS